MSMQGSRQAVVLAVVIGTTSIRGCATRKQFLSDADRANLRSQPVITVIHYVTPLPEGVHSEPLVTRSAYTRPIL